MLYAAASPYRELSEDPGIARFSCSPLAIDPFA